MYKDRGTIKWTAMMLPEHVQQLRKWRKEVEDKKPEKLQPWQLEEMNNKIVYAFEQQQQISLFLYESSWSEERGYIEKLDNQNKMVFFDDGLIVKRIPIHLIYRVQFHD